MSLPFLVTLNVADSSDAWLRAQIRGLALPMPRVQRVLVETPAEAQRIVERMAQAKHAKRLPYGGSSYQRVEPCPDCEGDGILEGEMICRCEECAGRGYYLEFAS